MINLKEDLDNHFRNKILVTASELQSTDFAPCSASVQSMMTNPCDSFAEELLAHVHSLPLKKVSTFPLPPGTVHVDSA